MLVNPGGPGGSGLDFVLSAPPVALDLFSRFDVVSWDPRGVGTSTPTVDCTTDDEDNASVFGYFTRPGEVDRDEAVAGAESAAEICFERNPEILPYLSTANVARDLDLMRAAVGDRQLTHIGLSHGTHIGAAYATLYPGQARALLLDAPVDPEVWVNHPIESGREQLTGFEDARDRFFAGCAVQQDECGFGGGDPELESAIQLDVGVSSSSLIALASAPVNPAYPTSWPPTRPTYSPLSPVPVVESASDSSAPASPPVARLCATA